jgi:hypothetical protein
MKELDSFTVEQLTEFVESDHAQCGDVSALARIALAAKRAEESHSRREVWDGGNTWVQCSRQAYDRHEAAGQRVRVLYERPQLNSPEIPEGWIKCSDHKPDSSGEFLVYETLNNRVQHDYWVPDDCAALGLGFWNHYANYVTHWMPLPTAPEKENG